MIAVTGSTGNLGRLAIAALLRKLPASEIVAIARNPGKASDLAEKGVQVRKADYTDRAALESALKGVDKLLLISSSEVGKRYAQHKNVIEAAAAAGVGKIYYTSLLHADTSTLDLAAEHLQTEALLKESGIDHVLLRNGWYTENYTGSVPSALANGAFVGSAGAGRIASAPRADYAEAAAALVSGSGDQKKVYELAGDSAYTLSDLAAEISRQSGKDIPYRNLSVDGYAALLVKVGLPEGLAKAYAGWDGSAAEGALFDDSHDLSRVLGRPTTPLSSEVAKAIAAAK